MAIQVKNSHMRTIVSRVKRVGGLSRVRWRQRKEYCKRYTLVTYKQPAATALGVMPLMELGSIVSTVSLDG
jgi:hypothetical protein